VIGSEARHAALAPGDGTLAFMPAAIRVTAVRTLDLVSPSRPGRPAFVTAASGLVRADRTFYVVADDELHVGVFAGRAPGQLVRLFEGTLPIRPKKRKRVKPDLEALALLPDRSLLALPSGSRARRITGARLALSRGAVAPDSVTTIDVGPLYAALGLEFDDLNIEGVAVTDRHVVMLQRGNGASRENAVIWLDRRATLARLGRDRAITPREIRRVARVDLGELRGVPFGFTDACALPNGSVAFVAAAEAGDSTYEDGACLGSAIGIITRAGAIDAVRPLRGPARKVIKAEGVWISGTRAWFVTDADDPGVPSVLYEGRL
jgi:hypothetical protein